MREVMEKRVPSEADRVDIRLSMKYKKAFEEAVPGSSGCVEIFSLIIQARDNH